jgi:putative ABC transport system permease protein
VAATVAGIAIGVALLGILSAVAAPWLETVFGLAVRPVWTVAANEWPLIGAIIAAGLFAGAIPAWRAARLSLADGLTPRI